MFIMKEKIIDSLDEKRLKLELESKDDMNSLRLKRLLNLHDLSRSNDSPLRETVDRILKLPDFEDFDIVNVPEIVPVKESFDLFNFPHDHPARNSSDSYFLNQDFILRPHTTIMWYYYLSLPDIKEKINKDGALGVISYGKVYRKDEIDRSHMNVFHQMDGLYLYHKQEKTEEKELDDLKDILIKIVKAIYGNNVEYRFNKDTFPYTQPSIEMEIKLADRWVEVLGAGIVNSKVLDNLSVDSKKWSGWAFGFGLERLAILSMNLPDIRLLWSKDKRITRQLHLGNIYKEVSKYPPIKRDISFVVKNDFLPNNYFDLIRDIGGDAVEEVSLMDKYENAEKFGVDKVSYTYTIVYRSNERTLKKNEIEPLQKKIIEKTRDQFNAEIR